MIYATRNERWDTVPSPSGSREATEFQMIYSQTGRKSLKVKGKTNIYNRIQESAPLADINTIIKRATLGDESVLNKVKTFYADVTDAPKSLQEMQNMVIKAQQDFSVLPAEIRQKFGNNVDTFINEIGSAIFNEKLGVKPKQHIVPELDANQQIKVEEVKQLEPQL